MRGLLLVVVLLLSACGAPQVSPGPQVDVATEQLRQLKKEAGIEDCPSTDGAKVDTELPSVELPCLGGGRAVQLDELKGPMVLNLWAQWCGPCRAELPHYQAFATKHPDIEVLGIDWNDTQPALALELAKKSGVTYPLLADTEPKIRGQVLPRVLLIDEHGKVVHDEAVEIKSVAQLEQMVAEHLGAS